MLRQEVPAHLVRHAHVAKDDPQDILVDLALAHEAHRQIRSPSWNASVTPCTFCEPGAAPPMSTWCAEQATKPMMRSPRNSGMIS